MLKEKQHWGGRNRVPTSWFWPLVTGEPQKRGGTSPHTETSGLRGSVYTDFQIQNSSLYHDLSRYRHPVILANWYSCLSVVPSHEVLVLSHSIMSKSLWPHGLQPTGSFVHGVFQARILEWAALSSSRGSSWPRDHTCLSCTGRQILYPSATWGALGPDK